MFSPLFLFYNHQKTFYKHKTLKKMKKLFAICFFALLLQNAMAQKLKKEIAKIDDMEYEEAIIDLNSAIKKSVDVPVAYYKIGEIYFLQDFEKRDVLKSFDNFQKSKEKFARLDSKTKDKIKLSYNITPNMADSMMLVVAQSMLDTIKQHSYYSSYIDKFRDKFKKIYPKMVAEVDTFCYMLAYKNAYNIARRMIKFNDLDSISNLPNHPYADSAKVAKTKIQQEMFDFCFNYTGYPNQMNLFRKMFDESYYVDYTEKQKNFYLKETIKHNLKYNISPRDTMICYEINNAVVKDSIFFRKKYNEAKLSKFIENFAPRLIAFLALKTLYKPYIEKREYSKAVDILQKYQPLFPNQQKFINKTIGLLSDPNPPQFINETQLPPEINSPIYQNNYAPILSYDMKKLYYVQDMDFRKNWWQEDMYVSEFKDGKWQLGQPIKRFSEYNKNEAAEYISPDESEMILFLSGYLYTSPKQDDGTWGYPIPLLSERNSINSGFWNADVSFSADGQALLFSSIRNEKDKISNFAFSETDNIFFCDIDIYVSLKQPNGNWGPAINLGSTINTDFIERSPRLSSDLKTLYFVSNSHYGIGGCDFFMSTRLNDTSWTEWSEPINLGRIINTTKDENFFTIGYDGKTIFYNRDSIIYQAQLPDIIKANPTSNLCGKITDSQGNPIKSTISWEDINTGRYLGTLKNNPTTGEFSITMPLGRTYEYIVESEGYFPVSAIFDNSKTNQPTEKIDSIKLYSITEMIQQDISVTLNNIYFELNKADLKPESMVKIKYLAKLLTSNPDLKIEISGHTDKTGSDSFNQNLSQQRAESVKKALEQKGVNPQKIVTIGYGSTKPISSNDEENRRVEFKFIND